MKGWLIAAALLASWVAGCAHPVEQLLDQKRQERIDAAYAGQPLTHGAGDGLGKLTADDANAGGGLTVSGPSQGKHGMP